MKSRKISPTPSIDSNDELLSEDELENEMDDEVDNPDVDDLEDEEIDEEGDENDLSEDDEVGEEEEDEDDEEDLVDDTRSTRKNQKRKKAIYEEPDSDDDEDEDDYEVVSNRPLTKRQRAKLENNTPEYFLELPMESGKKKHLTEEEQTLKRSEVARRRKNQSIQRAEKDKEDTINRLLKKQASKSRRIIKDDAGDEKESGSARRSALARDPNSLQYVSNAKGSFLSIPTTISVDQIFGPSYD